MGERGYSWWLCALKLPGSRVALAAGAPGEQPRDGVHHLVQFEAKPYYYTDVAQGVCPVPAECYPAQALVTGTLTLSRRTFCQEETWHRSGLCRSPFLV